MSVKFVNGNMIVISTTHWPWTIYTFFFFDTFIFLMNPDYASTFLVD